MILAVLFYTQLGYFGQFVIQQWMLKEEAHAAWISALPDRCLFRVSLAAVDASGHWTEAGRECWYNNHLYDVIRRKTAAGTVWLYCMDDEREATLIRRSGEITHANHDRPDKQANHSLSPRIGDWLAEIVSLRMDDRPLAMVDRHFEDKQGILPAGWTEIVVPPPRM